MAFRKLASLEFGLHVGPSGQLCFHRAPCLGELDQSRKDNQTVFCSVIGALFLA